MRYLTLGEVVELHRLVLAASGGAPGIRDLGVLESAVAQPRASFGGSDLHPTLIEKTGALGFALAQGGRMSSPRGTTSVRAATGTYARQDAEWSRSLP